MHEQEQLHQLLDREIENLQALRGVLHQEYEALVSADINAIEQLSDTKSQVLSVQADLTSTRRHFVESTSGNGSDESLEQYITDCGNQELLQTFSRLSALAMQCNVSNRTNGRLIAQKQQQTRSALDILRHTDSNSATYSNAGTTSASEQAGRTLGKA